MFHFFLCLGEDCLHLLLLKQVTVEGERNSGRDIDAKITSVIVTCFAERLLKKRGNMPEEVEMLIT